MQLIFLLSLVIGFASLLNPAGTPTPAEADLKLTWSMLTCASVVAFAWWIGQLKHQLAQAQLQRWYAGIEWAERLHGVVYLVAMLLVFRAFDFAEIVLGNWRLDRFFLADDVAILVPLTMPLVCSWFLLAPNHTGHGNAVAERLADTWLRARHLILLPMVVILFLMAMADLQRIYSFPASDVARQLVSMFAVLAIVIALPWLLRWCWPTHPLEAGPARSLIESTLAAAGVSVGQILYWDTRGQLANAAMAGLLPRIRYLFVTDELLRRMTDRDLQAITAHEAAHCRFGHLPRLTASLAIPFLALLLGGSLLSAQDAVDLFRTPVFVLAVLGIWSVWHGRWARLLEHQADVAACRLLSGERSTLCPEAVEAFAQALRSTGAGPAGDWLHPSPAVRVALLHQFAAHPEAERGFERRLRLISRGQWLTIGLLAATWLYVV